MGLFFNVVLKQMLTGSSVFLKATSSTRKLFFLPVNKNFYEG